MLHIKNRVTQSNFCKNYNVNKETEQRALNLGQRLKLIISQSSGRPLIVRDKLNDIATRIQRRINKGNLTQTDLNRYKSELAKLIHPISSQQSNIDIFFRVCILLSKHETTNDTKLNYFGITNKTDNIKKLSETNERYNNVEDLNPDDLAYFLSGDALTIISPTYISSVCIIPSELRNIIECISKMNDDQKKQSYEIINYISVSCLFNTVKVKIDDRIIEVDPKLNSQNGRFAISIDNKIIFEVWSKVKSGITMEDTIDLIKICIKGISSKDMCTLLDNFNTYTEFGKRMTEKLHGFLLKGNSTHPTQDVGKYLFGLDLRGHDLRKFNLSGVDLTGTILSGADLSEANLSGHDLRAYNLNECNLSNCNLSGCDLSGVDLTSAILAGANLSGCNLSNCNLSGCNLNGVDLTGAILSGANLSGAILPRNILKLNSLNGCNLSGCDLSGLDLTGITLTDVNLRGCNLSNCNLSKCNLNGVDLTGTILSGADLSGCNLSKCKLGGVNLTGTILTGANLSKCDLNKCNLSRCDLSGVDLTDAILTEANLSGAILPRNTLNLNSLSKCNLSGCDLSGFDLTGAILTGANLSGCNLTNTILTNSSLSRVSLSDVILMNTQLIHTDLNGVNLRDLDLTKCNITKSRLANTNLAKKQLIGLDLSGCDLSGINLSKADLTGTILVGANLSKANLTGVNLTGCDLTGTIFTSANLRGCNLTKTILVGANLSKANLTGVNLTGCDLIGTIFTSANLSGCKLINSCLVGANLSKANLTGVNLTGTILTATNLDSANLDGANLSKIKMNIGYNTRINFSEVILGKDSEININFSANSDLDFNHLNNNQSGSLLTQINSIDNKYKSIKFSLMEKIVEYLNTQEIFSLIEPLIDILLNSNFDYLNSEKINTFFIDKILPSLAQKANQDPLIFTEKQCLVLLKYVARIKQNYMVEKNGFFIQLIHQSRNSKNVEVKQLAQELYGLYLEHYLVKQNYKAWLNVLCGDEDTKSEDALDTMKDNLFFFNFDVNEDCHFLVISNESVDKILYPRINGERKDWPSDIHYFYNIEMPPMNKTNKSKIFEIFNVFQSSYEFYAKKTLFKRLVELLNLGQLETDFLNAILVPEYDVKLIDDKTQFLLQEKFQPHLIMAKDPKELRLTSSHLNEILATFGAVMDISNPKKKAMLLLTLSGIFAKYSSARIFGTERHSPQILRYYAYVLMEKAYITYNGIISEDKFREYTNRFLGLNGAFDCTAVLSRDILETCKQSEFFTEGIIPPAWI